MESRRASLIYATQERFMSAVLKVGGFYMAVWPSFLIVNVKFTSSFASHSY